MNIEVSHAPQKDDLAVIYNGLVEFNEPFLSSIYGKAIACYARDDDGAIIGGLNGRILYSSLYIDLFWVHEKARGKGVGKSLLQAIEADAKKHLLETIFLDTFSFQAPEFYEKYEYLKVGELKNYPRRGITRFFYQKTINCFNASE